MSYRARSPGDGPPLIHARRSKFSGF